MIRQYVLDQAHPLMLLGFVIYFMIMWLGKDELGSHVSSEVTGSSTISMQCPFDLIL